MSFRRWVRERSAHIAFGTVGLLSSFNATVAERHADDATRKLAEVELTQPYRAPENRAVTIAGPGPSSELQQVRKEVVETREAAKGLRETDDQGREAIEKVLPEIERKRPRKRGR